jgi:hypothetical protein
MRWETIVEGSTELSAASPKNRLRGARRNPDFTSVRTRLPSTPEELLHCGKLTAQEQN